MIDDAAPTNAKPEGSAKPDGRRAFGAPGTSEPDASGTSEEAAPRETASLTGLLSPREEALLIERALSGGAQEAAEKHLAEGRPIYYRDEDYDEHLVKELPGGRRFYVGLDEDYEEVVRREIPARTGLAAK